MNFSLLLFLRPNRLSPVAEASKGHGGLPDRWLPLVAPVGLPPYAPCKLRLPAQSGAESAHRQTQFKWLKGIEG